VSLFEKIRMALALQRVWEKAKEGQVEGKSLLQSKTFWVNLVAGVVQFVDGFGGWNLIPQPWGVVAQSIANIVLRVLTDKPITSIKVE
jgi:hypothetical protein